MGNESLIRDSPPKPVERLFRPACDKHGMIIPEGKTRPAAFTRDYENVIADTERWDLDYILRLSPDIMDVVDATKGELSREERAAALGERCRIHRVRYVEDLPVSVLEEIQRGRC